MVQFSIEELLCKDGVNIWRLKGFLNKKKIFFSVAIWYSKTFFFPSPSLTKQRLIISLAFWFISLLRMVINFLAPSITRRCLSNQGSLWCLYTYWHIPYYGDKSSLSWKRLSPLSLSLSMWYVEERNTVRVVCIMTSACSLGTRFHMRWLK